MRNENNTSTFQSLEIFKVLLNAKWEEVKTQSDGAFFTPNHFAHNWESIYVRPSELSSQEITRGMRKLVTPTLLITTKGEKMAFVLASEETPIYIPSGFKKDKELGYVLAFRLAPILTPEYVYYMSQYDEWQRIVDFVDVSSALEEDGGWKEVGQCYCDEFSMEVITPESILRNHGGKINLPPISIQKELAEAAKEQLKIFEHEIKVSKEEIVKINLRYLSHASAGGIFQRSTSGIGLLRELYHRAAGTEANIKVLEILKNDQFPFVADALSSQELTLLQNNLEVTFSILVNPAEYSWDKSPEYFQPKEVTDFILKVAKIPEGVTVYNPFSGVASYGVSLPCNQVIGEELNEITWAIAQIRIFATGTNTNIFLGDSFQSMEETSKYEAIVTSPCYLRESGHEVHDIVNGLYNKLSEKGKLVCLVPVSYLYSKTKAIQASRERLIKEHAIQAVITLPSNIFPGAAINQAVLVLSKDQTTEFILMGDATKYTHFAKSVYRMTTFKWEQFLQDLEEKMEEYYARGRDIDNSTIAVPISYTDIYLTDLLPSRYLVASVKDGIHLSELAEEIPSLPVGSYTLECFITSSSIPASMHRKPYAPTKDLNEEKIATAKTMVKIQGDAVVVALGSSGIRTAYMENTNIVAGYPNGFVFFLKPKDGVSAKYLAAMLSFKVVADQLKAQATGGTTPRLDQLDLTRILVPRHDSIEECERVVTEVISSEMSELESELQETLSRQRREVRSTRHAMIQTLSALSSNWEQLKMFTDIKGGKIDFADTIGKINPIGVKELMGTIGYAISTLERQVESMRFERMDWGKDIAINPYEFINSYIYQHSTPSVRMNNVGNDNQASFPKYEEETKESGTEHTSAAFIFHAPVRLIERIFNNIVSNAMAHGFNKDITHENEIRFDWESNEGNIVITIANNGSPLKDGVTGEDVLMSGFSTALNENASDGTLHSGQGGFEIKSLMEGLGSVEVISQPDSEFPVIYKLTFEKTNFETINLKD